MAKKKPSTENSDALWLYFSSKIPGAIREHKFHPIRRWKFDMASPALMVAVEYEGGSPRSCRHATWTGSIKDAEKYSTAGSMGWIVLRFFAPQVQSGWCYKVIDDLLKMKKVIADENNP